MTGSAGDQGNILIATTEHAIALWIIAYRRLIRIGLDPLRYGHEAVRVRQLRTRQAQ